MVMVQGSVGAKDWVVVVEVVEVVASLSTYHQSSSYSVDQIEMVFSVLSHCDCSRAAGRHCDRHRSIRKLSP
jgi:hypothetical protein